MRLELEMLRNLGPRKRIQGEESDRHLGLRKHTAPQYERRHLKHWQQENFESKASPASGGRPVTHFLLGKETVWKKEASSGLRKGRDVNPPEAGLC